MLRVCFVHFRADQVELRRIQGWLASPNQQAINVVVHKKSARRSTDCPSRFYLPLWKKNYNTNLLALYQI